MGYVSSLEGMRLWSPQIPQISELSIHHFKLSDLPIMVKGEFSEVD